MSPTTTTTATTRPARFSDLIVGARVMVTAEDIPARYRGQWGTIADRYPDRSMTVMLDNDTRLGNIRQADLAVEALPSFSKTEATRRFRLLASECKRRADLPKNARVEIGDRNFPVAVDHHPTKAETHPEGDDLRTFSPFGDDPFHIAHGAVLHLYLSRAFAFGEYELDSVCTVWMGTPDADPIVLASDTGQYDYAPEA
jgi:hypothetical protein